MLRRFRDAHVLIADDNVANIQLLVALLERAGLEDITTARDGEEALALMRDHEPDLVLLDLRMPKLDGYAVLEQLAGFPDAEYLPVLVLTADTAPEALERALQLGARDFLTKPFDAAEVGLRVRNLLEMRYLYRALREHNIALAEELEKKRAEEQEMQRLQQERIERTEYVLGTPGMLSMLFQPVVSVASQATVGFEALARFASGEQEPQVWFSQASSVGLGPDLEMAAVRTALGSLAAVPAGAFLAVNVSPELVMSHRLDTLADSPVCERLVLEFTEHVAVEDYSLVNERLALLRSRGVRVAIDDTGAGFASLRHILSLRPEIIKLDLSLTRGVDHDPARRSLAAALVGFADEMGARLVAEGVETASELQTLERLGIDWVQGFHIAEPGPLPG